MESRGQFLMINVVHQYSTSPMHGLDLICHYIQLKLMILIVVSTK